MPPLEGLQEQRAFLAETKVEILNHFKEMKVYYTLDGSGPTQSSHLYTGPITLKDTATIKAKGFLPGGKKTETLTGSYSKQQLRKPVIPLIKTDRT